jgi:hypothetical protein
MPCQEYKIVIFQWLSQLIGTILTPTRQFLPDLLGNFCLVGNIYPAIFTYLYLLRMVRNGIIIAMHNPCQFNQMQMRIIRRKPPFHTMESVDINAYKDTYKDVCNNICNNICNNGGIYVCNSASISSCEWFSFSISPARLTCECESFSFGKKGQ